VIYIFEQNPILFTIN